MMPDELRGDDARLSAALTAMQHTPEVTRDTVALVAARAVIANAPAARATRWTLRAAAVIGVVAIGALLIPNRARTDTLALQSSAEASGTVSAVIPMLPAVTSAARPIVFELEASDARSVQVLGDFNGWSRDASRMQRDADGRWRLTTLLPPGRYVYAYLVDGERFVRDPGREAVEDRDFGVTGSELVIGEAP